MKRILQYAALLTGIYACGSGDHDVPPRDTREIPQALPVLEEDKISRVFDTLGATNTPIAVLADGRIAVGLSSGSDDSRIRVFAPGGQSLALGRGGRGPGELQVVADLFADRDRLLAYDMSGLKLVEFHLTENTVEQHQFQGPVFPLRAEGDSIDVLKISSKGRLEFQRMFFGTAYGRVLLDERDSLFRRHFIEPVEQNSSRRPPYPARASNGQKLAVADPIAYRIYEYDASTGAFLRDFGRDLPPKKRSQAAVDRELASSSQFRGPDGKPMSAEQIKAQETNLKEEVLPFFGARKGLAYDKGGHLWVVGTQGDSVAIDVFAQSEFLGRISVPCPNFGGSWASNGQIAAFVCMDLDVPQIKVFNIR
jgi:hypothetical protein